jgi:hypothetical protein
MQDRNRVHRDHRQQAPHQSYQPHCKRASKCPCKTGNEEQIFN